MVKDLDRTMEFYSSTFGIGPWRVMDIASPEMTVRGKVYSWRGRVAWAQLGPVEIELLQVWEGRSSHTEFFDEGREGLQHLCLRVADDEMDQIVAEVGKEGIGIIQSAKGQVHRGRHVYLDSGRIGGVIFELSYRPSE